MWKKKIPNMKKNNLQASVKHGGGSITVWGCMNANGVESVNFIDGIMKHKLYIDIL